MRIAAVVVVLIAVVVGWAVFATSGPADAVSAHLAAIARGDTAAAYATTSSGFKSATKPDAFAAFLAANPVLGGKAVITDRLVEGDTATVTVDLTGAAGEKRTADFQLVKEGDAWLISAYRIRAAAAPSSAPAANASAPALVSCTSPATRAVDPKPVTAVAPKTVLRLYSAAVEPKDAQGRSLSIRDYVDTKVRSFSIAALKAGTGDTLHFSFVALNDVPADLPTHSIRMEVCDAQNQTAFIATEPSRSSPNTIGSDTTLNGGMVVPARPGTYRVDAYVWLEQTKTWYLVSRVDAVTFTP